MKMNVPNTLTIIRVLLIPFFVAFMLCNITAYDNYIALAIFIVQVLPIPWTDIWREKIIR